MKKLFLIIFVGNIYAIANNLYYDKTKDKCYRVYEDEAIEEVKCPEHKGDLKEISIIEE